MATRKVAPKTAPALTTVGFMNPNQKGAIMGMEKSNFRLACRGANCGNTGEYLESVHDTYSTSDYWVYGTFSFSDGSNYRREPGRIKCDLCGGADISKTFFDPVKEEEEKYWKENPPHDAHCFPYHTAKLESDRLQQEAERAYCIAARVSVGNAINRLLSEGAPLPIFERK